LTVEVVLDRRLISLAEIERLREGSVYTISSAIAGKAVALCCNGRVFARGELVSVEGHLGVLVNESVGDAA
jgi:flagellar motor switch/type III secretory pathway protein FliN